jgi:hypothetical protein
MKEHKLEPILNSKTYSQSSNYSNLSTDNQMEDDNSLNRDINNTNYLYYLGGFAEGEGSNTVTVNVAKNFKYGVDIKPEFNVSQHVNGIGILNSYKELFKAGSVNKKSGSDNIYAFKIKGTKHMIDLVIPFLEKYVKPFSGKVAEYNLFVEITNRCSQGHNVDKCKLIAMLELIYHTGKMGKGKDRKRTLEELLYIINNKEEYFNNIGNNSSL